MRKAVVRARSWLIATFMLGCAWTPPATDPSASRTSDVAPPSADEASAPAAGELLGPGWRVREGVLETVHERVRVRPPVGWRLVLGDSVNLLHTSFLLRHQEDGVYVGFHAPVFAEDEHEGRWGQLFQHQPWNSHWTVTAFTASFAGRELAFVQGERELERHFYHAPVEIDGRTIEVVVMTDSDLRVSALAQRADDALSGVELLATEELERLRVELASVAPNHDLLAEEWSLRGDRFRHFEHGVELRLPRGFWLLSSVDGPAPTLLLSDPSENLQISISLVTSEVPGLDSEVRSARGLEQRHEATIEGMVAAGLQRSKTERREVGSITAMVDRLELEGSPRRLHVVNVVHGEVQIYSGIHSKLGPERRDDAEVEALIDELLAGLQLGPSQVAIEQIGSRLIDRRSGFSIDVGTEAEPDVFVNSKLGRGYTAMWLGYASVTAVNGAGLEERGDELRDWMASQTQAEFNVPELVRGQTSERSVAGLRAQWLRWHGEGGFEVNCLIFVRDRTVFAISQAGDTPGALDRLLDSFAFID